MPALGEELVLEFLSRGGCCAEDNVEENAWRCARHEEEHGLDGAAWGEVWGGGFGVVNVVVQGCYLEQCVCDFEDTV